MASILIVEDEIDLVEAYIDLLSAEDHTIYTVANAAEAIQAVSRYRPDLIVLDLNLPGESGFFVINFVRQFPPVSKTPIIIASGCCDLLQKTTYISSRVNAILSKPVENTILLETIHRLLDQKQPAQAGS